MKVVAIHIAKARKLPTRTVESVVAEAGTGLVGDRYHGTRHRHATIQSQSQLDDAAEKLGHAIDAGATRRNITVDAGAIPTKPGTRLWIGDVEVEVVRLAAPCRLLDDWIGAGAMAAMHGCGGSVCRLLSSGVIRIGDAVEIASESLAATAVR